MKAEQLWLLVMGLPIISFTCSVKSKITALTSLPPSSRMSTNGKSSAKHAKDGECMSPIGISIGVGLQESCIQTYFPSDSIHTNDVLICALAFRVNRTKGGSNLDGIFDRVIGTSAPKNSIRTSVDRLEDISVTSMNVHSAWVWETANVALLQPLHYSWSTEGDRTSSRIQVTLAPAAKTKGKERVIYRPLEMPEISVEHRIATTGWQRYLSDVQSGV
ncbi:hypothetical protein IW261DRAFT_1421987 [Armillaria novae-zelandiae]|uniref:Uncharacterized protein n=1 Tax=Armillaria novae-zelandiae TaxID=153914 RepID=A0AA39P281_9AGAR|nr:hypothetical protein IW261DRAFT_1421987 [Armillaria novae-zelandiae]